MISFDRGQEVPLYLIYNYLYAKTTSSYFLCHAFQGTTPLPPSRLHRVYEQLFSQKAQVKNGIGPFDGGEQLHLYVKELLAQSTQETAYLLSMQEYNLGLETVTHIRDFPSIFESFGKRFVRGTHPPLLSRPKFFERFLGAIK